MDIRKLILDTANDAGRDFSYYDRKDGNDLSQEMLSEALDNGTVRLEEVLAAFKEGILENYTPPL